MTTPSYTETEVKLSVPNLEHVKAVLERNGAELIAERVFERNTRYENAEQTLGENHIVLRLRQDTRARLTYKEPPLDAGDSDIPSRFEAEVEVSDFDTMDLILGKLGYFPHMVYEKYRTTYRLGEVEVVLDELPYGNFVEIEGDAAAIREALTTLGLQSAVRFQTNYLRLFENVRYHLNLKFDDLTFANFEGITVPLSAFDPP